MTARKIRMTAVGLVAMPADRDERTVTADDLGERGLTTAFAEVYDHATKAIDAAQGWADSAGTYREKEASDVVATEIEHAWDEALSAAADGNLDRLRRAIERARDVASVHDLSTEHEDAALAMLPPVQKARAA